MGSLVIQYKDKARTINNARTIRETMETIHLISIIDYGKSLQAWCEPKDVAKNLFFGGSSWISKLIRTNLIQQIQKSLFLSFNNGGGG